MNINNINTKKTLYYIGQICILVILWLIIQLLPLILKSSWQGVLLITTLTIFLMVRLYFYLPENQELTKMPIYNILIIFITLYFLLIYFRIFIAIDFKRYLLNTVSIKYCKTNFLILSCSLIGVVLNSILYKIAYDD